MSFTKRVSDTFGIVVPKENDIMWVKQGGGMSCLQRKLEGVYIPIGEQKYNLGGPEWEPSGPNFVSKLRHINVHKDIPADDFESLPARVKRRGNFDGYTEYSHWIENHETYGWVSLYEDLRRFTHGFSDNLDTDPRNRWGDVETLWEAIDASFSFNYEFVSNSAYADLGFDSYPRPEPAIRPIRIYGSKESETGRVYSEWANDLEDEVVFLLCPNAD